MKSITITQLHYLDEVAKNGHFGLAAAHCFVTQPTLSMQIQKLEDDLGVLLLDRSKKPVEPTPMGHRVLAVARNILGDVAKIEELIRGVSGEVQGDLSIGVIPTLAPYLLPRLLQPLTQHYPKLELTIEEIQTEEILRKLRENRLDLGIAAVPLTTKGIVEVPLFREPFVAYLSQDHPLQKFETLNEKQLAEPDLWLLSEGHCFREQVLELCKVKKRKSDGQHVHFQSGNLETLKRLVDRKQGYTLLPYLAVQELSNREREQRVKYFAEPIPVREVGIVHTESFVKHASLEALKKEILSVLPQELKPEMMKSKIKKIPIKNLG